MPATGGEDLLDHGEIEALKLPPGTGGVLELDLHDRELGPGHVEEEAVGLAIAGLAYAREEQDPGRGKVVVRVGL